MPSWNGYSYRIKAISAVPKSVARCVSQLRSDNCSIADSRPTKPYRRNRFRCPSEVDRKAKADESARKVPAGRSRRCESRRRRGCSVAIELPAELSRRGQSVRSNRIAAQPGKPESLLCSRPPRLDAPVEASVPTPPTMEHRRPSRGQSKRVPAGPFRRRSLGEGWPRVACEQERSKRRARAFASDPGRLHRQ